MSTADSPQKLKPVQLSVLVILMAEAREVTNNELAEIAGFRLDGKERLELESRGLIKSRKVGRTLAFELSDKGWHFCKQLHTTDIDLKGSRPARAVMSLLEGVQRSLDRQGVSHADFFKRSAEIVDSPTAVPIIDPVEGRIRAAYNELTPGPGEWVGLADLRESLGGLDRTTVDETLRAMLSRPGVRIIPVANTKSLAPRDIAAALRIGNEDNHTLAIGPS